MVPAALHPNERLEVHTASVEVERRVTRATLGGPRASIPRTARVETPTDGSLDAVSVREIASSVVHPDQVTVQVIEKPKETTLEAAAAEVMAE